MPMRFHRD
nr:unnamed protein product [Callosobruchus chinensis]